MNSTYWFGVEVTEFYATESNARRTPGMGGVLVISFSVPRFVPNGSSGTLKTTELLGLPLATDGPRHKLDNLNPL